MKINVSIEEQFGLSRLLKVFREKNYIKTPSLLLPIHPAFPFLKNNSILPSILNNNPHFVGMNINDNLFTSSENDSNILKSEEFTQKICFQTSKSLWGISDSDSNTNTNTNTNSNSTETLGKINILGDHFANTQDYRYEEYEMKAQNKRLKLYQDILFKKKENSSYPDTKYVVEFTFGDNQSKQLDEIIEWINLNEEFICGIKINNIFNSLGSSQEIINWIHKMKNQLRSNLLWIVGGKIFPENYALAIYCGFDIIDASGLIKWGSKGLYLTSSGPKWVDKYKTYPCICPACKILTKENVNMNTIAANPLIKNAVITHNVQYALNEIAYINAHIEQHTLRTYVEGSIHSSPSAASFLRNLDKHDMKRGGMIRKRYPLISSHSLSCIGSESYVRPEVINYINRIKEEIFPIKSYKYVILLPCSAKKPYSSSKSHQKFRKVIKNILKKNNIHQSDVHEVIVTSPLGIIPRELESIFPVSHYDIPVTGDWDAEEIESTANCIIDWIKKYSANQERVHIIAHLNGGYKKACQKAEKNLGVLASKFKFIYTLQNSKEEQLSCSNDLALSKFEEVFNSVIENIENHANEIKIDENSSDRKQLALKKHNADESYVWNVADYQFGKGVGKAFIENGIRLIKDKNPHFKTILTYDGTGKYELGKIFTNTGFIKLTSPGGELIYNNSQQVLGLNAPQNHVRITEETFSGGSIFSPILDEIDPNLHPGDEVLIISKTGEYLGVGTLNLYEKDSLTCNYGKICSVRKKK